MFEYFSGFAGIGGFDQGIKQALPDAKCIGYSEVDKHAIKIYEKNFPDRTNYGDIRRIKPSILPKFEWFCGGFPCQDLSIAGEQKGIQGERSGLFFEIIRIIREKQPELVFLENVKGLLSSNGGWDFAKVLTELEGVGYDVEWQVLNSKNFGVPQNRERVFIIGHLRTKPCFQVFPIREEEKISVTKNKTNRRQSQAPISTTITEKCRQSDTFVIDANGRMDKNITGTLTHRYNKGVENFGSNPFIYTDKIRRLTPLECERLQGFPDGWTEIDKDGNAISDTQRYKCLGNAVTVNVIEAIIKKIVVASKPLGLQ